jgi:hypothetical protein
MYHPLNPDSLERSYDSPGSTARPPEPPAEPAAPRPVPAPAPSGPVWRPPDPLGATEYVVRPKDTLSQVAQDRLGTTKKLPLLLLANPAIASAHAIGAGEHLVLPGPGYFAGPFLVSGERAATGELLRWSEPDRTGFLGVAVEDSGPGGLDRHLVLEVRDGRSRLAFSSADQAWRGAHFDRYRRGWDWEAVDLDGDKGLDLVASNAFGAGSGSAFYAYAFHAGPTGYRRHALAEGLRGGEFAPTRRLLRDGTIELRGVREQLLPEGQLVQPVRVLCRWTGAGFELREAEAGPGSFERAAARPPAAPAPSGPLK